MAKKLVLGVLDNNIPAKKLYEKLGFKLNGKSVESLNKENFNMSGNINSNTFVGLTYHELSQEGFGLPSIRSFRVASEPEIWKNPLVLKATDKVKQYAAKKHLSLNFTVDTKKLPTNILQMLLAQRGVAKVEDSIVKECLKYIKVRKVNGVNIISIDTVITQQQYAALCVVALIVFGISFPALCKLGGTVAGKAAATVYNMTGSPTAGYATAKVGGFTAGFLSAELASKLARVVYYTIGGQLKNKNESKDLRIFGSWALFKNENGQICAKRFCNGVIDPAVKSSEDLEVSNETDDISMTDLVENETTVEEDAGKDSVPTDVSDQSQADTAHNEEASSGGVVTPENQDTLEVEPTETDTNSTEAWYDDPAYSLEETGEDGVCMDCLVENETTVEEDAGKDSEVKDANPTEAETEHNEEASAGGVLTGDNKDDLEVKETSEEVLGITDYDLYSKDEYKSIEGIFDPDDLKQ